MSGRLIATIAFSLVAHAVLLILLDRPAMPSVRLPTLEVVLAGNKTSSTADAARDAAPSAHEVEQTRPRKAQRSTPSPDQGQRGLADAGALPTVSRPARSREGTQATTALVPDYSQQLAAPTPPSLPAGLRPSAAEDRPAAGVVLAIRQRLAQFQAYPAAARRRGVEGAATVQFVIGRNGELVTKSLLQSSGSPHLDQAAMKLISDAAPYPELPTSVSGERLEVRIPIDYRLNQPAT